MEKLLCSADVVLEGVKSFIKRRFDEPERISVVLGMLEGLSRTIWRMDTDSPDEFNPGSIIYAMNPRDHTVFKAEYCERKESGGHVVRSIDAGDLIVVEHVYPALKMDDFEPVVLDGNE